MKINWHRQHKWSSLAVCAFLLLFCISGLLLNHRNLIAGADVNRALLPPWYTYENWNQGLMRGAVKTGAGTLIFGAQGIWRASGRKVTDFNRGLPAPSHFRNIRALVQAPDSQIFALSTEHLYRLRPSGWQQVALPADKYSDLTLKGDTLVVLSRSRLLTSAPPYSDFQAHTLQEPAGGMRAPTAFRTVWLLHSGQLFGLPGVLVVDLVALVFIALAVTGLLIWIFPKIIRRHRGKPEKIKPVAAHLRRSVSWHKALGICTIVLTMLICITGWALRPPVLVGLVKLRMPALPGSALDTPNPWQDKLRMIRYDRRLGRWLISTSEGFYSMPTLSEAPVRIGKQPPVSVMGLNVFAPDGDGWLIGSLSGMYRWNPQSGAATDYFTGKPAPDKPGPPFGLTPVAGYTEALGKPMPVRYDTGTPYPQPEELRHKPMALWQVALETHTGRILLGNSATYYYVFAIGLLLFWSLLSGWKMSRTRRSH